MVRVEKLLQIWLSLEKRFLPHYVWGSDSLTFWRERILFVICFTAVVLGPIALIPSLVLSFYEELWSVIFLDSIAYLAAVAILLLRSLPLKARASAVGLLLYALGAGLLFVLGPVGAGYIWLFGASIIVSTLIGIRAAVLTFALNVFVFLSVAVFIQFGAPDWAQDIENALEKWLVMSLNFLVINSLTTITTALMLNGLKNSLQKEQEASIKLRKSEARFELAMDASKDGIYDWNLMTNEIYYSPGWKRMLGYEPDEIKNEYSEWKSLTEPEDFKASWEMLNEVIEGKRERFELEYKMRHKNDAWVDILSRANVYRNDQGKAERLVGTHVDITERKKAEDATIEREQYLRTILQTAVDGFFVVNAEGKIIEANQAYCLMSGYTRDELLNLDISEIDAVEKTADTKAYIQRIIADGSENFETRHRRKDGIIFDVEMSAAYLQTHGGILVCFCRDITERLNLQAQLIQAQKMESVGRLAGGVAHDYNNALSVIIGFTELAMEKIDPAGPLHADLNEVLNAARHATDITRQLLAFARKQIVAPVALDLNDNIETMLKMLRRLIGEDIDLAWLPGTGLWLVKMDPSQIDQILANLCVNARDAIAGVGKVTIETMNKVFDAACCADHAGFIPGEFVLMTVSDNGCGMDKETQNNIFEPFFTTKDVGKGTGLGLATVYGIVKQNKGFINVYSEPGKGTSFKIYLPRYEGKAVEIQGESTAIIPSGLGETILIVEDELSVLKLAQKILDNLGYSVLIATTPGEALRLAEKHADKIQLLITDVIMPEMNGHDLANRLQSIFPGLKCVFMSGYTREVIASHGVLDEGMCFLQKPFCKRDLAITVRKVLDEVRGAFYKPSSLCDPIRTRSR